VRVLEPQSGLDLDGVGCWGLFVKEREFRGGRGLQNGGKLLKGGGVCMICRKKKERPKLS